MQTESIPIKFNGKKEVLEVVKSGYPLNLYMFRKKEVCPLIGAEIKFGKLLGRGREGVVYELIFRDLPSSNYVVKKVESEYTDVSLSVVTEEIKKYRELGIDVEDFYTRILSQRSDPVSIPPATDFCTGTGYSFKAYGRSFSYPKSSHICDASLTENIVGFIASSLIPKSPHIIDMFDIGLCKTPDTVNTYIFMEKIDFTLKDVDLGRREMETVLFQLLFTFAVFTDPSFQIVHADCHEGNIFCKKWKEGDITIRGDRMGNLDQWEYKINGTSYYVVAPPYIVKVGDYGFATKYSEPVIMRNEVMFNEFRGRVPNWYSPVYDIAYFCARIMFKDPSKGFETNQKLQKILQLIYGISTPINDKSPIFMPDTGYRPNQKMLIESTATPISIITAVFPDFTVKNPSLRSIVMGDNQTSL